MKKILFILLLVPCFVFGQTTDATLTTQAQQIKNETTAGANTANRVGTHLQNLVYSKKSFFTDGTASGTDTYSVSLDNGAITALTNQWLVIKFTNANTGASTLNPNAIGAKALVKTDGSALSSGDIDAGSIHILAYDGTNLQVLSLGGGGAGGGAWGSITGTLSDQTDLQAALDAKASLTGVETLTNKRWTPRVQSVASSATVTPNADADDAVKITAQAAGLTLANPSGTPTTMQAMVIRIKDNGTARAITYGSQYRAIGIVLPTTTVISKTLYLGIIWNDADTKWDVIGYSLEP